MMYQVDVVLIITAVGIAGLTAVYLWSKDPGRRRRAWRLLRLLLSRLRDRPVPQPWSAAGPADAILTGN
jgi:hypothetical protein